MHRVGITNDDRESIAKESSQTGELKEEGLSGGKCPKDIAKESSQTGELKGNSN